MLRGSGAALLVENQGFVVTGGCGASEDENEQRDFVRPGADDKVFRLDPKPLAACAAIRDTLKPKWASLGAPIRQRLVRDEALCFSRSYDAAHLAKHPHQTVKRIAVLKAQGAKPVFDETANLRTDVPDRTQGRPEVREEDDVLCRRNTPMPAPTIRRWTRQQDFFLTRDGEGRIMLRDRRGRLSDMFAAKLGTDDRMFRLQAGPASACEF